MLPKIVFHSGLSWQDGSWKLQYMSGNTGESLEKTWRGQTKRVADKGIYLYKDVDVHFAGYELYRANWFLNYTS